MLQVVRKTLAAGAAVALSAAMLTLITAAPAHAAVGRVPCGEQWHVEIITVEQPNNRLCFRGTGVLDVAIYNIGVVHANDRWVAVYYIRDAGGPVEGQILCPKNLRDDKYGRLSNWPLQYTHIHMITRIWI
jgi:hypothetical protein